MVVAGLSGPPLRPPPERTTHPPKPHFSSGAGVGGTGSGGGHKKSEGSKSPGEGAAFDAAAEKSGVSRESILQKCKTFEVPDMLVEYARLRDLTILPQSDDRWCAEAVIFGSGKPTLVLPQRPRSRPFELGTVVVAWDFSRVAARAVSDALPMLEKAKKVRVLTVLNEKHLDNKHAAEGLSKNLSRHGIDVVLDRVDAKGRRIGEVLEAYVASHASDMLVMGAYGHSRLREFVLGGATKSLLSKPPLPILFSH